MIDDRNYYVSSTASTAKNVDVMLDEVAKLQSKISAIMTELQGAQAAGVDTSPKP